MKSEQERIKELLKQELERDADKTIAEVEADKSLENIVLPEGLDECLAAKIQEYEKQREVYEKLSDEDKSALRIGREIQMQKAADGNPEDSGSGEEKKTVRFRKRRKRAIMLVAAVAVLTLAFGMTSIGGKPFIPQLFEQMLAGRKNVNINSSNSDEDKVIPAEEVGEEEAYQEIKDKFGFDAVELRVLPQGTSFLESNIDLETQEAYLIYDCRGTIIEYRILANNRDKSFGYDVEDGLIEKFDIQNGDITIDVNHYKVSDNGDEIFSGQFVYKNINYVLRGALSKAEFEEIVKNLKFF